MSADSPPPDLGALLKEYNEKKASLPNELQKSNFVLLCMQEKAWCENCDRPGKLSDKCKHCGAYHTITDKMRESMSPQEIDRMAQRRMEQDRADELWTRVLGHLAKEEQGAKP